MHFETTSLTKVQSEIIDSCLAIFFRILEKLIEVNSNCSHWSAFDHLGIAVNRLHVVLKLNFLCV